MTIERQIRAAHAAGNTKQLAILYEEGAGQTANSDNRLFLLTQAYIFALDSNAANRDRLAQALRQHGRL